MARTTATTLKIPETLKVRIAKLAKKSGRAAHAVMLEALERQVQREERMATFVQEALDSDRRIDEGEEVYRAEDVHAWMERLAAGEPAARPKPWRR